VADLKLGTKVTCYFDRLLASCNGFRRSALLTERLLSDPHCLDNGWDQIGSLMGRCRSVRNTESETVLWISHQSLVGHTVTVTLLEAAEFTAASLGWNLPLATAIGYASRMPPCVPQCGHGDADGARLSLRLSSMRTWPRASALPHTL
jgi:hypothetical protein